MLGEIGVALLVASMPTAQGTRSTPNARTAAEKDAVLALVEVGDSCEGGIKYDDATFEIYATFQPSVVVGSYAMRFQLPGPLSRLDAICLAWLSLGGASHDFGLRIWAADGFGGSPGTLLSVLPASSASGPSYFNGWFRVEIAGGLEIETDTIFVAPVFAATSDLALGVDLNGPGGQPAYFFQTDSIGTVGDVRPTWPFGFPDYKALGIRIEVTELEPPPPPPDPPAGEWLTTDELPGYEFKVRITSGATMRNGTLVSDCVPETLCVAGALKNRTEVFVRIIGPRGNGFLWPEVVRFTVAQVEVWTRDEGSSEFNYYKLDGVDEDSDVLNGVVDRRGFLP